MRRDAGARDRSAARRDRHPPPRLDSSTTFAGAAIAIGACEDDDEARRFAAAARAAGVPVNVIDKPKFCDFAFGAIVNRSPLVIGISTDGAAPVFGQAIRAKLEALIPRGFARWAEAARRWRRDVQGLGPVVQRAPAVLAALHRARGAAIPTTRRSTPTTTGCSQRPAAEGERAEQGSVTLVGAGPGDPELLTLRAVRALQSADVILFDDLVSPEVLDFARREAKKMLVGKTGYGPSCKQDDINALMVGLAKSGKRVVRLKGGDPMIFGRAGEEIAACRKAGIAVEVVPGITAAQGAASRLGVSLTHRKEARRLQYVTGHAADGKLPRDIDWRSLADPSATTVDLHAGEDARRACRDRAIAEGLDPATPADRGGARDAAGRDDRSLRRSPSLPARLAAGEPARPGRGDDRPRASPASPVSGRRHRRRRARAPSGFRPESACRPPSRAASSIRAS